MSDENAAELEREGLKLFVEAWEDGFRTKGHEDTFEWWYFDMQFEDFTVVVTFSTNAKSPTKPPLTPNATTLVKYKDGTIDRISNDYAVNDFSSASDGCDVKLGKESIEGDLDKYKIHTEGDGYAIDMTLKRGAPSWRPSTGITYYDRARTKYVGWVVPVPYGTVEIKMTKDGKTTTARGTGYHDHNWGNVVMAKYLDHWYWGRAHIGDLTMIFVQITTAKMFRFGGVNLPVFYLADKDKVLVDDASPLTLVPRGFVKAPGGSEYPTVLDWHWHTGEGDIHIALRDVELIDALDLLSTAPEWERPLLRLLAKPYYLDFNAKLELSVDIPGLRLKDSGKALFELMLLK